MKKVIIALLVSFFSISSLYADMVIHRDGPPLKTSLLDSPFFVVSVGEVILILLIILIYKKFSKKG